MNEDVLNAVLAKIDNLNKNITENKESSSKVLLYLANKNKEFEKTILTLRNDIDDLIEAENNSYNEIEALNKELEDAKAREIEKDKKIKELETKLNEQKAANEKSDKSFDLVNKSLFKSIEQIKKDQETYNDKIDNLGNEIKSVNDKVDNALVETTNYILIDKKSQKTKFGKFLYKIFHYRQLQELERQKAEEERLRQLKIQEELERKKQEEEQKKLEQKKLEEQKRKEERERIKNILNGKPKK